MGLPETFVPPWTHMLAERLAHIRAVRTGVTYGASLLCLWKTCLEQKQRGSDEGERGVRQVAEEVHDREIECLYAPTETP